MVMQLKLLVMPTAGDVSPIIYAKHCGRVVVLSAYLSFLISHFKCGTLTLSRN